jgi:hypothetical protein
MMGQDRADPVALLRDPATIRARCAQIFDAALAGRTTHFGLALASLPECVRYVGRVMDEAYPDGAVPFHARWRHFVVAGRDRWAPLAASLASRPARDTLLAAFDLAIVSVLLDAGAGADWRYCAAEGDVLSRSEGLAIASLEMFAAGAFSADPRDPLRADAAVLAAITPETLAHGFQAGDANPLVGLSERAAMLRRLGDGIASRPALFGGTGRVGGLAVPLLERAAGAPLAAAAILDAVLVALGPIWPARIVLDGVNLGDVGRHPAAVAADRTDGLVPFHKLSQWLAYSLIEPLAAQGVRVIDLDALTGLPEYRNGGLFIDMGVIVPRHGGVLSGAHEATSELVVEWRALTVCLLDRLAVEMRAARGLDAVSLPLAKVLEGGTWAAGRRIARDTRPGGTPPVAVISDGTVF